MDDEPGGGEDTDFLTHFLKIDNNVVKYVAFICKSNPMYCTSNNYKMLLNAKNKLII